MSGKMMRFVIVLAILACTLIGCGLNKNASFKFEREKIKNVYIEDAVKGYYTDELKIELTPNEIALFMQMVPNLEVKKGQSGYGSDRGGNYLIVCYDDNDEKLYEFNVDSGHSLNLEDCYLKATDDFDAFFDEIEVKYGITLKEARSRQPGPEFFSRTEYITKIEFNEHTANNFIKGVDYTFSKEEVEELKGGIAQARFIEGEPFDVNKTLYSIDMYDKWGSSVYCVSVSEDNEVRINSRAVDYDSIKEWLSKMEQTSGLERG